MNRQYCVLLYGPNEPYSAELFRYLKDQPFDFAAVTGLAKVCVNKSIKDTLLANGITKVPCILIKYYNQTQDHLEGDQIYAWIDALAHQMGYGAGEPEPPPLQSHAPMHPLQGPLQPQVPPLQGQMEAQMQPPPTATKVTTANANIMEAAKTLQKDREDAVGVEDGKSHRPGPTS